MSFETAARFFSASEASSVDTYLRKAGYCSQEDSPSTDVRVAQTVRLAFIGEEDRLWSYGIARRSDRPAYPEGYYEAVLRSDEDVIHAFGETEALAIAGSVVLAHEQAMGL